MASRNTDWSPANWPRLLFAFFSSFKVATVVFVLMTVVTLFGTLHQVDHGLHAAKVKYFYSLVVQERLFDTVTILLPGGLLLMSMLFINIILGAIVKVRKRWRGAGMLVAHSGMLLLLVGGFVTWKFGTDGYMALYPGMVSNKVESYRSWQMEVVPLDEEGAGEEAFIIPAEKLRALGLDEHRLFKTEDLPFDVMVKGFARNSTPIPVTAPAAAEAPGEEVNGFKLSPQRPAKEAEQNLPGCHVEFRPRDGGEPVEAILWAGSYRFDPRTDPMPFVFEVGGQKYGALLAKKSWTVPFEIRLDEFIFERHPGVSTARNFESRVTRFEEGHPDRPLEIRMNEPMRYAGFTFFQESFGPAGANPGDEMFSQFAVANNPADQWPLVALIITGVGMGIHFLIMLVGFMSRSSRPSKPAPASGKSEPSPQSAPEAASAAS